jgi:hypothetical protein
MGNYPLTTRAKEGMNGMLCYPDKLIREVTFTLRKKLSEIADFMEKNGLCSKEQLHGIRTAASAKGHVLSVDSWNAYVHNQYYNPSPSDLKNNWDSIQSIVEQMWEV